MKTVPSVAIVILNYNGKKYLAQFLPSVLASEYPNFSIIVADNHSTDDSIDFLKAHYPTIQTVVLEKNYGFAEGYNQALKQIDADYYILLNSDIEVTADWISPLIKCITTTPNVAAVQPKILSYKDKLLFEHAGAAGGFMDKFAYPFCRGRIFTSVEKDERQYDNATEIFWASGAALCINATLFHKIGGFDGDYFAHMEEIDLCWRLKRAGYSIWVVPQSVVYHVGGGTLDYDSPFKVFLNFRNSLFTILKNESWAKLSWFFVFRLILDGVAGLSYLSKKQFNLTYQILKAHFACYAVFLKILSKRKKYNQRIADCSIGNPNSNGQINQSIVYQFFIKKKTTYTAIMKNK